MHDRFLNGLTKSKKKSYYLYGYSQSLSAVQIADFQSQNSFHVWCLYAFTMLTILCCLLHYDVTLYMWRDSLKGEIISRSSLSLSLIIYSNNTFSFLVPLLWISHFIFTVTYSHNKRQKLIFSPYYCHPADLINMPILSFSTILALQVPFIFIEMIHSFSFLAWSTTWHRIELLQFLHACIYS